MLLQHFHNFLNKFILRKSDKLTTMSSPSNVLQLRSQKLFELRQKYKEHETSMTNSSFTPTFSEDKHKHIVRPQEVGRCNAGSDILNRVIRSLKQVPFTGEFVIEPRKCSNKPIRNSEHDESLQFTGIEKSGKNALDITMAYESDFVIKPRKCTMKTSKNNE